jgi:hypothetical protein
MIHSSYLKVVEKHKGFKLIMIYLVNKNVTIEPITLKNCDKKGIIADFEKSGLIDISIPFFNELDKNIINLYNLNDIDLLEARQVTNLKVRLKDKVLARNIVYILKQALNLYVSIIIKLENKFAVVKGILINMNMDGLIVKSAPFYNQEQVVKYSLIYSVFDDEFNDLINIDED